MPQSPPGSTWLQAICYYTVVVIWPLIALWRAPSDTLDFAWMIEANRIGTYITSALFLWTMFLIVWAILRINRMALSGIGFRRPRWSDIAAGGIFMLVALPILGVLAFTMRQLGIEIPEMVIRALVPGNSIEWCFWVGLSMTAAVSEETIFRGYLLTAGERVLRRRAPAVIIAAIAFGIGHVYQGIAGVILISIYALMLTWLRFRTVGLWAPIIAHTLQNVIAAYLATLQIP